MKKTHEVYKVVNTINGKIYVGITNQGYKTRWYKHCSDAIHDSSFPIHQAIRKYGVANFTVEVLETYETIDNLKEREIYWIKELNSRTTNGKGYNLTAGGDGTFGKKHSEETKEKIRQKALGREYSEDTKLRMSLNSASSKIISQFTLKGELIKTFRNVKSAAEEVGGKVTNIAACARGIYKSSCGFKWSYTDEVPTDPIPEVKIEKKKVVRGPMSEEQKKKISDSNKERWTEERKQQSSINNHKNRQILQYDLEGNFVQGFRSVSEAAIAVGATTHTNIAKCARGQRKKACGYIWKYKIE